MAACKVFCVVALSLGLCDGFSHPSAPSSVRPCMELSAVGKVQRKWAKDRGTLAQEVALDKGGTISDEDRGIIGNIDVVFKQGNSTLATKAIMGQPLSEVATQADQFIRYKCKKGECGTCEVQVDGKWIRSCVSTIPYVAPGETYAVTVKPSMVKKSKKSSRFYSVRSFIDGWVNNIIGMFGFIKTSATEGKNFNDRIDGEAEILAKVAARKKAKLAAKKQQAGR